VKLKYERFEGLSSFSIRGAVTTAELKLLTVGLETLVKDLEETLVVNSTHAIFGKTEALVLNEIKKKLKAATSHTIFWVTREKPLGDFATIDLMATRLPGHSARQIGDRIRLDDEVYALKEEMKAIETKISELGGDAQNVHKIILENEMLKAQRKILQDSLQWQNFRLKHQVLQASEDEEIQVKLDTARGELNKLLGTEADL
jgi:hypothetical protein